MISIRKSGSIFYYHGQTEEMLHRTQDLPAITWPNGAQEYMFFGIHHRDGDLPSIIGEFGVAYYKKGVRHRDDNLPATIFSKSGRLEYWEHGVYIRSEHI